MSLGDEAVAVARKQRRLADVRRAREARDEALEPDREAAVRGHPVAERLQVALVRLDGAVERGDVVLVPVQTLAPGDELEAAEEEVEAVRVLRPPRLGMRVEGPLRHREPGHEDELAELLAEAALVGRGEVDVVDAGVREVDPRDLGRYVRNVDEPELPDRGDHPGDRVARDGHHVEVVANEAELRVERDVLGEVTRGLVRLGAEGGADPAGSATPSIVARWSSSPPGACAFATTSPSTSSTVSGSRCTGSSRTICASPARSRRITNVTRLSSRRWWSQPARRTRPPTC